jgi:hypothetical protein
MLQAALHNALRTLAPKWAVFASQYLTFKAPQVYEAVRIRAVRPSFTPDPRVDEALDLFESDREAATESPPAADVQRYVFISYHHRDRRYVERLVAYMSAYGVAAWYYEMEVKAGRPWAEDLARKIEGASGCIFLMTGTPPGSPSQSVQKEISWSERKDKIMFPISVDDSSYFDLNPLQRAVVHGDELPSEDWVRSVRSQAFAA